jgi:hypothetical protein
VPGRPQIVEQSGPGRQTGLVDDPPQLGA